MNVLMYYSSYHVHFLMNDHWISEGWRIFVWQVFFSVFHVVFVFSPLHEYLFFLFLFLFFDQLFDLDDFLDHVQLWHKSFYFFVFPRSVTITSSLKPDLHDTICRVRFVVYDKSYVLKTPTTSLEGFENRF